jgi:3-oxoacyl-[acyl-carrier protein] reductase
LDFLVNNGGTTVFADHFDLDALQKKDFMSLTEVNIVGTFQMTRACVPYMKKNGKNGGSVVMVSSLAGIRGIGSSIAYAATKGAMNTMVLSLARVLGPEIRVNAVW